MDLEKLNLSSESLEKINSLALAVELNERMRFRPRKQFDDLISLLKVSGNSVASEVQKKLASFQLSLTPDQMAFFKVLGVSLDSVEKTILAKGDSVKGSYRGSVQSITPKSEHDEAVPAGKKKIVYRGQVKWV